MAGWLDPRNWPAALASGLLFLAVKSLPVRALQALGSGFGRLAGALLSQRREVARVNLEACFPALDTAARDTLLREHLSAVGCGLAEAGLSYWASPRALARWSSVEGLEHLQAARAGGTGVLVLAAHYTSMELAGRLANDALAPPAHLLIRHNANPLVAAMIERAHRRHAAGTLDKKNLKGLFRLLGRGEVVMYAPDQNFTYASVFAPFFGVEASTVTATAEIIERTGARLVPMWCTRLPDGRYRLRFEPAWTDYPGGDPVADARRVNAWIEDRVREAPAQYLWVHRRFRTRPPGEPPLYPDRLRRAKHRDGQ